MTVSCYFNLNNSTSIMNNRIKSNKHMTYVLRIDKFPILKYEVKT